MTDNAHKMRGGSPSRLKKRPSFHLDVDSSDDEDTSRRKSSASTSSQINTSLLSMDDTILRFPSESIHSFSYAIVSQNSISTRIAVLKRSLEYFRDNPLKLRELRLSLSLVCSPSAALKNNNTSSATLSMLNSLTLNQSTENSSLDNLSAVLNILQNADSSVGSRGYNMTSDNATTSLFLTGQSANNDLSTNHDNEDSPSTSTPGSPRKKRTRTNVSAVDAETQVLEALATPFVDVAWTSIMQRTGSVGALSAMIHSMSSLNLAQVPPSPLTEHTPTTGAQAANQITTLSSIASKFMAKHAVFTTQISQPFKILSSNDIACLVFGLSQSEMKSRSLLDIMPHHVHEQVLKNFDGSSSNPDDCSVVICGALYPISKSNDKHSLASFWVKHNRPKGLLVWVIEEILNDRAILTHSTEAEGLITKLSGPDADELFPNFDPSTANSHYLTEIFPGMCGNNENNEADGRCGQGGARTSGSDDDYEYHYHTLKSIDNTYSPCYTRKLDSSSLQISSLLNIAGVVILDNMEFSICSFNTCFMHALFGYGIELRNESINRIIPHFTDYISSIKSNVFHSDPRTLSNVGLVIPEHMFRKAAAMSTTSKDKANVKYSTPTENSTPETIENYSRFLQSTGITGINTEGKSITVDVQLRVVSQKYVALWISYSRPQISGESQEKRAQAQVPSQLKLFHSLRTRTDSSSSSTTKVTSRGSTVYSDDGRISDTNYSSDTIATSAADDSSFNIEIGAQRRTKKISDFEVLQKMGEGAYGKVSLAKYRKEPYYTVVVKSVIKERILVDCWTRDRKLGTIPNEIKIMATLNSETIRPHQNIIKLLDFFEDDDFYQIEMERHGNPGTDLFDLIELRPNMDENECRQIFRQVVDAVAHLHKHGIVHRDIKDENIVVDEQTGVAKLIDFGSSAFLNQGPFDVFVGTIDYAAPEVLGGNPYSGKPQDVWALGILLYTIMYKENPFYNVDEIMDGELRIPFVPSDQFLELVKSILCRDVSKRPTIQDIQNHKWFN